MSVTESHILSNQTGLTVAEELSPKVLPLNPVWRELEPNTEDMGASYSQVARSPINSSRQRRKGAVTDLDSQASLQVDLTTDPVVRDLLQGYVFADIENKGVSENVLGSTQRQHAIDSSTDVVTASGDTPSLSDDFSQGDLVLVSGSFSEANNGLFKVDSGATATTLSLIAADGTDGSVNTVDELATSEITLVKVGAQGGSGAIEVSATGGFPQLTSLSFDFTTLGLVPGEWIYVGGDELSTKFATAANNGFARVRSVTSNVITVDKTSDTWVTDNGATKLISLFIGRRLRNRTGSAIKRRSYQFERSLGAPNSASPGQVQYEYVTGAAPSIAKIDLSTADKVMVDLEYIGLGYETLDAATGKKSGTRPTLESGDAYNASNHVKRTSLRLASGQNPNNTDEFTYAADLEFSINNNVSPLKAIGTLGGFDTNAGELTVDASLTAFFADIVVMSRIANNDDMTLDTILVQENKGVAIDLPLVTLGSDNPQISANEAVTLPLTITAVSGNAISSTLDHTIMFNFFDYLPTAAG